ncbi:metalloregulator ArsR/SmtB family transcription factor [Pseudarthrobacter psychrotolerans]|uniref:Metalloregulator ArsR/SmtB family transcription factor n=1 Tax=Pseudarthrobacter psychrotolerans TaxID=2697569 RepID=A0A6P1NRP4_9MICC|nr:metalloregulator ArsR/SmtB family transcription factor [Pseudarthrobacter psychrotolerans]QHK21828.1 metalloregulator ArsR/SmtB family transcription factor [Pseudarthrobacter psychrotolerans]
MGDHQEKEALFDGLVEAARALGNGRRAELIDVLAQGERSVDELAAEIHQSMANTSQHLQRLLRAGLVCSRRSGTRIYYSLASPAVERLWRALRETAEAHMGELGELVRAYVGDRADLSMITRDELRRRLLQGDVVVLDVRPQPEYDAGHIPGALSLPVSDLKSRLSEVPQGSEIVAYCRGPYCLYADDAVQLLTDEGRRAARLEEGFPEWKAEGLPIEQSTT